MTNFNKDKTYNGHKTWGYWNVSLWLSNDEGLERLTRSILRRSATKSDAVDRLRLELSTLGITHTPDGAVYSRNAIRSALRSF